MHQEVKNVSFQTILIIVSNIIVPCFYEYDYNHNSKGNRKD